MQNIYSDLQNSFGEVILVRDRDPGRRIAITPLGILKDVAQFAKDSMGFDHVLSVSVMDNLEDNKFVVGYHLGSIGTSEMHGEIFSIEVEIDRDSPSLPSLAAIWPSAEFHEREGWELFGVVFEGHSKLERLLLPESWKRGYPLRKDFELGDDNQ